MENTEYTHTADISGDAGILLPPGTSVDVFLSSPPGKILLSVADDIDVGIFFPCGWERPGSLAAELDARRAVCGAYPSVAFIGKAAAKTMGERFEEEPFAGHPTMRAADSAFSVFEETTRTENGVPHIFRGRDGFRFAAFLLPHPSVVLNNGGRGRKTEKSEYGELLLRVARSRPLVWLGTDVFEKNLPDESEV